MYRINAALGFRRHLRCYKPIAFVSGAYFAMVFLLDQRLTDRNMFAIGYAFGFMVAKVTVELMIAHITDSSYPVTNPVTLLGSIIMYFLAFMYYFTWRGNPLVERNLDNALVFVAWANAVRELTSLRGVGRQFGRPPGESAQNPGVPRQGRRADQRVAVRRGRRVGEAVGGGRVGGGGAAVGGRPGVGSHLKT